MRVDMVGTAQVHLCPPYNYESSSLRRIFFPPPAKRRGGIKGGGCLSAFRY
jgi:hypothetical protein